MLIGLVAGCSVGAVCGAKSAVEDLTMAYTGDISHGAIGADAAVMVEGIPVDRANLAKRGALNGAYWGGLMGGIPGVLVDDVMNPDQ